MKRARNIDDGLLALAARLYYLDGLGQAEVARLVDVSQAKVSRMLRMARERGIVQITVAECDVRVRELEQQLCAAHGLEHAVVVQTAPSLPVEEQRRALAHFASPFVADLLGGGRKLVVAGGRSLQALVHRLEPGAGSGGITVLQGMGNIDTEIGDYDAIQLGSELARRCRGTFRMLNCPALVAERKVRETLLALPQTRSVMEQYGGADMALVGIGNLESSVFIERGTWTVEDVRRARKAGAVGEIVGRFFDAAGEECTTPLRERVISIDLAALRSLPRVVAVVAGGADRAPAIRAALASRLVTSLVTDQTTAEAVLAP